MQEAALTCKAEHLNLGKGIAYVHADLATAECQLSRLRFRLNVHALLPHEEKISACQESQNNCKLLTTKSKIGISSKINSKTALYRVKA